MNPMDILEGWPIDYGPVCLHICQKTGKGVVVMWDVLESVGPGHDEVGIEQGVDIILVLTGVELIFFLVAVFWI